MERAYFCSTVSGAAAGKLQGWQYQEVGKAGYWNLLKARVRLQCLLPRWFTGQSGWNQHSESSLAGPLHGDH